jgi:dephospho-CoA kinase
MLSVGISGGIGSGKSLVCTIFQVLGISVYNSDLEAKKIMETNEQVKKEIIKLLGKESYFNNLTLNRKFIAKKIFNQKELLQSLNQIVHPAVRKDAEIWREKIPQADGYYLRESAILFETGIYKQFNYNILVTAPQKLRIERIKSRDALSVEDITLRMKNQWDDEQKLALANFVIVNDGKNFLIPQILKIHKTLKDYSLMPTDKLPNINL